MKWQGYLAGVVLTAFFGIVVILALNLSPAHARGDVGGAFLPVIIAACGIVLSLTYLVQIWSNRDSAKGAARRRGLIYLGLFGLTIALIKWVPLALGLAAASLLGVLLMDGPERWLRAGTVAATVFVTTWFGFGWLLELPLP
ncbi:tripartite tricarboxylate transporter TctB family protein [Amorphus sp. 3PC139-8]|uniref:tripartite tricarboxylate transporter TctB family protein n=1 Tax=Amorphus sp. 3PC139-8 TaxID=2735676 RepID=UPI00345D4259